MRRTVVSANNNGATFAYDSLGRRTDKDILSANTNFLYDGVTPVQELNGSTVTANLLTGGVDEYFTRTDSSGTSNFLTDALGSTIVLTDTSGNSQVQYSYAPFGNISITGTTNNTYTYTGRETDGLGLYFYRARYYNPATGRFISEDPIGFAGGEMALYAYAGDDPISYSDPFGLDKNPPPHAPNNGKPDTPAFRQLRENAQELQSQVNHPFAWNGPQMTGAKIGALIGITGNAIAGCAGGVLLAPEGAVGSCTAGAFANSVSPMALASDLLTTGVGFAVGQYQLKAQAQQAWAQYDAACTN